MEATPVVRTLELLLDGGFDAVPGRVRDALEREGYSAGLSAANNLYSSRGPDHRSAVITYAVMLLGRGLIDEALGVLRRVRQSDDEGDPALRLAEADARVQKGDEKGAEALLEQWQQREELDADHCRFAADRWLELGRPERAVRWYRRALEEGHQSAEAARRLARLLSEQGEREEAAASLAEAAQLSGDDAMLWRAAAESCWEAGLVQEAIDCWEGFVQLRPYDTDAWFSLGLGHWYLDQFEQAAEAFEEVVGLNPRHRVAWRQLGDARLAIGHGERALEAFRRGLELTDDDVDMLNGAVLAAYQTGDLEAALDWARRAMELAGDHPESRYNYGIVLLARGRAKEALEVLESLVDTDDEDTRMFAGPLAVAELKEGRGQLAREHIEWAADAAGAGRWLSAFTAEVLKTEGVDEATRFVDAIDRGEPAWRVARALLGFVCSGLAGQEEAAEAYARQFCDSVRRHHEALPLPWSLEHWEALALRLHRPLKRAFEAMLAVAENRKELDQLDDLPFFG